MRRTSAAMCSLTVAILIAGTLTGSPVAAAEGPAAMGEWSDVMEWPFIPIHASIDQDGNVLTYGGKGAGGTDDEFNIDVWNPSLGDTDAAHVTSTHGLGTNLFCSFALSDPEGRGSIMLGGTVSGARGLPDFVARYRDGELTDFPAMHYPRWYGTGTTLPDGRMLMQGGTPLADDQENAIDTAEVYSEETGWVELTGTTPSGVWSDGWWYPKSFVTPAGKVWNLANQQMYYLDPDGAGNVEMIGTYNETANIGGTSSAVNFAPGMVLQIGSQKATIFDLNYDPPRITEAAPMNFNRLFANAVVLPNGQVLVTGGSGQFNENTDVAYAAEVWDPQTNVWTVLAESQVPRLYHSTALLLPDGRIFTGGGGAPGPQDHLNAEIFSPPYLFTAAGAAAKQPTFSATSRTVGYGEMLSATSDETIERVTMIRMGHNTHAMNTQNFVELGFAQNGGDLWIETPRHSTIATPGEYMLFALNANGVPSEAHIVHISGESTEAPPAALDNTEPAEQISPWTTPPVAPSIPVVTVPPNLPVVPPERREVTCAGIIATIVGTSEDDILRGTPGRDVIAALQGNDTIYALGGDDIVCGGKGHDVLYGGQGFDTLYGAQGNDRLFATGSATELDDQRGARMFGGQGNDVLVGSNRWDRMQGGEGADTITGHAGRDWIRGGGGNDVLAGGDAIDDVHGGSGRDRIAASPGDRIRGGLGVDHCVDAQLAASAWSCTKQ